MKKSKLLFLMMLLVWQYVFSQNDPFLTKVYDGLHASKTQQKYRHIAPMPIGVVYVQRPGEGEPEMRSHFKKMKQLGYNCLKQIMTIPGWTIEQVQLIALDEGIIPWWYGEGGWEAITDALLERLNIPVNTPIAAIRNDEKMLRYQNALMKKRIENTIAYQIKLESELKGHSTAYEPELGGRGFDLSDTGKQMFMDWIQQTYKTTDQLNIAWNQQHVGLQPGGSNQPFTSWVDVKERYNKLGVKEYGRLRDILRFKVDHSIASIKKRCEEFRNFDSNAVFRGGGEISLFLPLAYYGVNMEAISNLMQEYGSFYPSIHFAWHYAETGYELVRPMYMQTSLATDFFKGGWAATWESTGGPQQFSGGKGGAYFTVDASVMTQFLLSQIAAGFKGWGTWTWSVRTAGWEAGEYGLLDRNNEVTDRAITTGLIGKRANELRDEIWKLRKEPLVGVLYDWDNEAIWATMSQAGRDNFKEMPVKARIGVSRAFINANVPFEYVTANDLRKGLAARYKVIYLPSILALNEDLLPILKSFVQQGGRLIMDAPTGYYNEHSALLNTTKGSAFEQLFGVVINDYQGAGVNRNVVLNGQSLKGFVTVLQPTTAKVIARFDNTLPAVTENSTGKGRSVVMAFEASTICERPGDLAMEKNIITYSLGQWRPGFSCANAIVYRLAGEKADHYFLINDGAAKKVNLNFSTYNYKKVRNVITGKNLILNTPIEIEANGGTWLRFEK